MGYAYASGVVWRGVDEVWDLVRQFDRLPTWHPFVKDCEMLEGANPAAVGARRVQRLANGGLATAQLIALDDASKSLVYEMLDGPWPVRNYMATVRVFPVTDAGTTFVEWFGRFDTDQVHEAELEETFREDTYEAGVRALQEWFAGSGTNGPVAVAVNGSEGTR